MRLWGDVQFGARLRQIASQHPDQIGQLTLGLERGRIVPHRFAIGACCFGEAALLAQNAPQ